MDRAFEKAWADDPEVVVKAVMRALSGNRTKLRMAVGKGTGALLMLSRLPIGARDKFVKNALGLTAQHSSQPADLCSVWSVGRAPAPSSAIPARSIVSFMRLGRMASFYHFHRPALQAYVRPQLPTVSRSSAESAGWRVMLDEDEHYVYAIALH